MKSALFALSTLMFFSTGLPAAQAAPKKATVATLAGTYDCLSSFFTDAKSTAGRVSIVVAKNGSVTGSGSVEETDPTCDPVEQGNCTTTRNITFKIAKLAAPKKKGIYEQSALKKTKIDATSGLTVSGAVRTFAAGSIRYRDISGTASLGTAKNAPTTDFTCMGPQTTK